MSPLGASDINTFTDKLAVLAKEFQIGRVDIHRDGLLLRTVVIADGGSNNQKVIFCGLKNLFQGCER